MRFVYYKYHFFGCKNAVVNAVVKRFIRARPFRLDLYIQDISRFPLITLREVKWSFLIGIADNFSRIKKR